MYVKIIRRQLTEKGIELTLDSESANITKVYIDKISNYKNCRSVKSIDHDFLAEFELDGTKLLIKTTNDMPTLVTITIFQQDQETPVVVMFMNEYSLFKAKTIYLETFDNSCCKYSECKTCNKMLNTLAYMMRLQQLHQCYVYNNVSLATKYYTDACRTFNLDDITFENVNLDPSTYTTSDKIFDLFHKMNETIKNSISPCAQEVFEKLLLCDLYSLLFGMSNNGGKPQWILEDHIWNLEDEEWYDKKFWKN